MGKWHLKSSPKKRGNKKYNYYVIAEGYIDEGGKHQKRKIKHLGLLKDSKANNIRLALKIFNGDIINLCNLDNVKFVDNRRYLDVAIMSSIYDKLGFDKIFNIVSDMDIGTKEVAKILVLSRLLDPQANYKTVDWLKDSYLPEIMGINSDKYNKDKIFRELENISGKRKYLQKHLVELSRKFNEDDYELYFFDATTSYFEGTACDLSAPGHDKQVGFNENVIMICLATDKKGNPVAWETFSGSKREIKEFKKIAETMHTELGIKNVTFCFDRGVASESNFELIEDIAGLNSKYITGLDRDQMHKVFDLDNFVKIVRPKLIEKFNIETEKNPDFSSIHDRIKPTNGYYRHGKDRYYQDLGLVEGKRYVVSFNINIFDREQKQRKDMIERTISKISELNEELYNAKKEKSDDVVENEISTILAKFKLSKIINYKIIPMASKHGVQTYNIEHSINAEHLWNTQKCDGVLIYVSNHTDPKKVSSSDIVEHYKNKYIIENAFRFLKSFADLRPIYVRIEEHVKAHVDICMVAYFINNYIYNKLINTNTTLAEFYELIKTNSRVCQLEIEKNQNFTLLKTIPKKLKEILSALEIQKIIKKEVLEKLNIKAS